MSSSSGQSDSLLLRLKLINKKKERKENQAGDSGSWEKYVHVEVVPRVGIMKVKLEGR